MYFPNVRVFQDSNTISDINISNYNNQGSYGKHISITYITLNITSTLGENNQMKKTYV